jgi:serine/threonine protein kinase
VNDGTVKEQSLFEAALALPAGAPRQAFLQEACNGDVALHRRMTKLLDAHTQSEGFFPENASEMLGVDQAEVESLAVAQSSAVGEQAGQKVGRYKLLKPLGEGGCGVVYLAAQEEPVQRLVALKIIKLGMDTRNVIARFDAERQALALMDHPNIAKVLDAGATEAGRPYFVMELVQGVRITHYCDQNHLSAQQRLGLFIQVCHALQHAHQKGVIHRDIKPSNILVALHDGIPVPKVIDFGIAKAISGRLTDDPAVTLQGQFVGTPAYMSPEQAEMSGLDVDTRSDIYSLGVLLYELLTGHPPFNQEALVQLGFDKMRQTLRETDPVRPSEMLTSMTNTDLTLTAKLRREEAPRLISSFKGDLDWIVMQALEKDRQRRYETANALALDVRRYLNDEPVLARPPSRRYRLKKLIQRNKVVYASGAAVVLSMLIGLGVSTRMFILERHGRLEQSRLRQEADAARVEAEDARANEARLRQEAEAREKVTQAVVLLGHGQTEKADALLASIPLEFFTPSTEATRVFRELGNWNTLQGRWREAADRYLILMHVNHVDKADRSTGATADLLTAAPLLVEAGDLEGYERVRRLALDRLTGTSNAAAAEQFLKTSLLVPADLELMNALEPFARLVAKSLANYDPRQNDGRYYRASWRALALGLWEYRRGNYAKCLEWLQKCSNYPDQSVSCVAGAHSIRSMVCHRLGDTKVAHAEFTAGKTMAEQYFSKKLELGNEQEGRLAGWIMNAIFLREAELVLRSSVNSQSSSGTATTKL